MAAATLDEETAKKVVRQVEFYFSDSNLPRDKFLMDTISESEDGSVSLALICSFSRMRSHLNLGKVKADEIPDDTVKAVAEALKSSTFLKLSEDGAKVRRTTELLQPEEVLEQIDNRTIAASPLEYGVKLEDVESFFGELAKVNSVRLPKHVADKRFFCGTALIEFSNEEDVEKVLKQKLVYAGAELELKPKIDFDAERAKQAEEVSNKPREIGANRRNNSSPEQNYPKGLLIAFSLKSLSAESSVEKNGDNSDAIKVEGESKSVADLTEENKVEVKGETEESKENAEEQSIPEKDGLKETEDKSTANLYKDNKDIVLREDLKAVFQKYGYVKYIDFNMGAESGYIRFEEPEAAQKARAAAALAEENGLIVKNYIATLDPVTGDAEREYWSKLTINQDKYRDSKGGNRGGRGGRSNRGGGGGRHYGGKHSRSRENNNNNYSNRPNKAQKV